MELDQETVDIKNEYLEAKRKYVHHMFPIYLKQFEQVLKSKNKTHKRPNKYEMLNKEKVISSSKSKSIAELFRKLSKRFHPDKLNMETKQDTQTSNELYQEIVRHYHDNNQDALSYIDKHGKSPQKSVKNLDIDYENTVAFQWGECTSHLNKQYYEDMFVTKQEYKKIMKEIQEELQKENDELVEQIKDIEQCNAQLQKLCEKYQE